LAAALCLAKVVHLRPGILTCLFQLKLGGLFMHADNTFNSPANMGGVVYIFQNDDHCNLAKQNGYPAIFFDEYHFTSQKTFPGLIDDCKNSKHVFVVCEDNDFSKESAIDLGCKLAKEGIRVFLTTLPASYLMINDANLSMFKKMANESPFLIELLVNNLADNYQKAAPEISDIIAPLILKLDSVSQKHYVNLIAKRIQTKIKIVTELIHSTKQDTICEDPEEENFSEEILLKAQELSKNPALMKIHVDVINEAGVVGERNNIAMLLCTINSRLVHANSSKPGQYVLATNIAGHYGSGKSYNLMHVLQAQPKNAYIMVTSASDQSLFHIEGGIKQKCLIFAEAFQFTRKNEDNCVLSVSVRSRFFSDRRFHSDGSAPAEACGGWVASGQSSPARLQRVTKTRIQGHNRKAVWQRNVLITDNAAEDQGYFQGR
jgi:hypothetical protein